MRNSVVFYEGMEVRVKETGLEGEVVEVRPDGILVCDEEDNTAFYTIHEVEY